MKMSNNVIPFPRPCRCQSMNGLGAFDWMGVASGLLSSGGGADAGGGAMPAATPSNTVTVNPNIQVSPQISPIFQQQFQPTNSAATAGASQALPSMPSNNAFAPTGYGSGGGAPVATPQVPAIPQAPIDWNKYLMYGGIAVAALFVFKTMGNKRVTRRRRAK